ncbi:MAG: glutathione transferase GstA [Gallionellaceae bacterium]
MLELYYVPGTCSLCPHIVLHEAGLGFSLEKVNPGDKKTETGQDYNAINPKSNVPALVMENGQLLTEVAVIVQYLADLAPEKKLAPPAGTLARYRLQEWLNFISSEIHKGYSPLFNPRLADDVKAIFKERLAGRISYAAKALADKDYLLGDSFSVADAYLFAVLRWSPRLGFELAPWPVLKSYIERIGARPAVKIAMAEEGL